MSFFTYESTEWLARSTGSARGPWKKKIQVSRRLRQTASLLSKKLRNKQLLRSQRPAAPLQLHAGRTFVAACASPIAVPKNDCPDPEFTFSWMEASLRPAQPQMVMPFARKLGRLWCCAWLQGTPCIWTSFSFFSWQSSQAENLIQREVFLTSMLVDRPGGTSQTNLYRHQGDATLSGNCFHEMPPLLLLCAGEVNLSLSWKKSHHRKILRMKMQVSLICSRNASQAFQHFQASFQGGPLFLMAFLCVGHPFFKRRHIEEFINNSSVFSASFCIFSSSALASRKTGISTPK